MPRKMAGPSNESQSIQNISCDSIQHHRDSLSCSSDASSVENFFEQDSLIDDLSNKRQSKWKEILAFIISPRSQRNHRSTRNRNRSTSSEKVVMLKNGERWRCWMVWAFKAAFVMYVITVPRENLFEVN